MVECYERGRKELGSDFYVVVITKKERLMPNVIRNYFSFRRSCPTPTYDQAVYHCEKGSDGLRFMWVIPARDICYELVNDALTIPDEHRDLLKFVLDYNDGTLLRIAKERNGECKDSPLLEN